MKQNVKLKGQLRMYLQWPAIMTILLIAMNVWIYFINQKAGIVMSAFVLLYILVAAALYFNNKSLIMADLVDFATQYANVQNKLLKELPTPYAILMEDGKVLWKNAAFNALFENRNIKDAYLSKYIPEANRGIFPKDRNKESRIEAAIDEKIYSIGIKKIYVENFSKSERLLHIPKEKEYFLAVYMEDITKLKRTMQENEDQRMVSGLLYIDNYEEVMNSVEEVRQSLLVALIDRKVSQYISKIDGIVRKLEKDKYFFNIQKKRFNEMREDKFSLIEEVKEINIGNGIPATISIGMGLSKDTYIQGAHYSRAAIDLALARGGDQAVVKHCNGIEYFGGKREQTAKNTRVKARVKAEALREFITIKDQVVVMGHKLADVDSFGAAIGIFCAAKALGKTAHIVIDDITTSVRPLYEDFLESDKYPEDMFTTSNKVGEILTENTMVVVVDTNKPELVECEELLKAGKTIVVMDHHRQSGNGIENAVLSYIEPYASSACEMISEMLQYIVDDIRLSAAEANSLYAGIIIDTNNFVNRTGVRTFEAAAFLKRNGANVTYVRKLFRDNMQSYKERTQIVGSAEVYSEEFAIAAYDGDNGSDSPTITGAQAANELLNIDQIKASFVLTKYREKIYVSARAIDEVNVQVIMERLGGGGHLNTAGAQFQHTNLEEAIEALKETLDMMVVEGEI